MIITKFHISNFRSLYDIKVDSLSPTTIFYGDNNVGKSNVLRALYFIFKRKKQLIEEGDKSSLTTSTRNFYEGIIEGFAHNFFNDLPGEIEFLVEFAVSADEINLPKGIRKKLFKPTSKPTKSLISFHGGFVPATSSKDRGEIFMNSVMVNKVEVYRSAKAKENFFFFPTVDPKKKDQGPMREFFVKLIEPFNDCVAIIESSRDMLPTKFSDGSPLLEISPSNFKKFLHELYLGEEGHRVFEAINRVLSSEPFKFGNLSFSRVQENLELMVQENDLRLPIKHVGSGVLQTLYIISRVIESRSPIVCIEELEQNLSPSRQFQTLRKLQSMIGNKASGPLQQILISSHSSVFNKPRLGTIYFLEKKDFKTIVNHKKDVALKQHFMISAPPPDTYTKEELAKNEEEQLHLGEEGFRR